MTRLGFGALALTLLSIPAGSAQADSLEEIFQRANGAYFRGDYEAASEGYQQLVELGVVDADVSYDLATSEARLGHYGAAVQHFERALWLRPGDEDARVGLDEARSAAGRRRADVQGVAEVDTAPPLAEALFGGISREAFAAMAMLSHIVLFGGLIGLLFVQKESRRLALGITAPLALALFAVSGTGLAVSSGWFEEGDPAVVLPQRVMLREGPDPRASERHRAVEGQRAWSLDEDSSLYLLRI